LRSSPGMKDPRVGITPVIRVGWARGVVVRIRAALLECFF
jgi:hypothetical protein